MTTQPTPAATLFDGLDDKALQALRALAHPIALAAGSRIFNLGEEARSVLLVEAGSVALRLPLVIRGESKDVTIEEKGPGSVIAWSALVPPHKLTLGAVASSDVKLIGYDRDALQQLFEAEPRLHARIMGNLCQVVGSRVALLEALVLRDLQRRVTDQ